MVDVSAKIDQARMLVESGRAEQARAFLERSLRQLPGHPDLANAMSLVLQSMGRADQALYHAQRAVQGRPNDAGYLQNLGNLCAHLGKGPESEAAFRKAIDLDPGAAGARLGLSHVLRLSYRYAEATQQLRDAIKVAPDDVELFAALSPLLLKQAQVEDAVAAARSGLEIKPNHLSCTAALAHCLNYMPGATGEEVLAAHQAAGALYSAEAPVRWSRHACSPDPDRKLRLGLLSGDFRRHAIMFFLEPLFEHYDPAATELACYSTGAMQDDVTRRVKARSAIWRDLKSATPRTIAEAIYNDRVDILIDLAGHIAGHNIPAVVAKPAPIIVNYLGYPATTGLPEVDGRIVDSLTDPAPLADSFASEQLLRIDPSFLCYRPPEDAPRPGDPTQGGPLTFGSFNSAPKLNGRVFRLWAQLLKDIPDSRLILKCLEFYDDPVIAFIHDRFAAEGIDPARIRCHKLKETFEQHLASYDDIDIALDPFPYNGTTTTCEALFMGVPVITLQGQRHVERVSAAILTNLGLNDLIATSEDHYLATAKALAADPARRAALRGFLRATLLASPLCDGPAFAARFTAALRDIWRQWCMQPR